MTPNLIAIAAISFAATLGFLFAVCFIALILSVRRAQEKVDAEEVLVMYRNEREATIKALREGMEL